MEPAQIKNLHARLVAHMARAPKRHGELTRLADAYGMHRPWLSKFFNDAGSCSPENYAKLLAALDAEASKESGDNSALGLAVRELRLLADILEAPEVSKEVKMNRYQSFIDAAAKGLRIYIQEAKKVKSN